MDPYIHTLIATVVIALAYYLGRRGNSLEQRYMGAENLLNILEAEGTYTRANLTAAVERWVEKREDEVG